jgi:RHS repeat-associated protein
MHYIPQRTTSINSALFRNTHEMSKYNNISSILPIGTAGSVNVDNFDKFANFGGSYNADYTNHPNNLKFVGRYGGYQDSDTGLTYFWHRWYNQEDGRWINRDPIGIEGGINLYGYVENCPNNNIDSIGLKCLGCNNMIFVELYRPVKALCEYFNKDCKGQFQKEIANCLIGTVQGKTAEEIAEQIKLLKKLGKTIIGYGGYILDAKCYGEAILKYEECTGNVTW